jgi:hypothetical protein
MRLSLCYIPLALEIQLMYEETLVMRDELSDGHFPVTNPTIDHSLPRF